MSAGDEIMTPVTKPEAVSMAEIHALRQISDTLAAQGRTVAEHMGASTRAMERLSEKVDGMNTRLIRLEEAKHGREIDGLKAEIKSIARDVNDLQALRDRQAGVLSVGGWISKYAPWLVALVLAGLAGLGIKTGAGG